MPDGFNGRYLNASRPTYLNKAEDDTSYCPHLQSHILQQNTHSSTMSQLAKHTHLKLTLFDFTNVGQDQAMDK